MSLSTPTRQTVRCRPLPAADRPIAIAQMAAAFHNDPVIQLLLPDEARRPTQLAWLMNAFVAYGARYGDVMVAGETPLGSAICLPSHSAAPSPGRLLRCGWARAPFELGWSACRRLHAVSQEVERLRLRQMPGQHRYLLHLSVTPDSQGQGIGSALLQVIIDRTAPQQVPCYLETFNAANLGFYMRHGFRLLSAARLPDGGLPFWTLARR